MAKIKVIQKTFSDYMKNNASEFLTSLYLGLSPEQAYKDIPDERPLWIDTKYVYAVSGLIRVVETGDVVFLVYLCTNVSNKDQLCLKGDCYEEFMKEWIASD